MATWHFVLYSAAAILALRSFVQLVANYRNEFEHVTVRNHLTKMAEELKKSSREGQPDAQPRTAEAVSEKQTVSA
jgi:hypothetical protein